MGTTEFAAGKCSLVRLLAERRRRSRSGVARDLRAPARTASPSIRQRGHDHANAMKPIANFDAELRNVDMNHALVYALRVNWGRCRTPSYFSDRSLLVCLIGRVCSR